MGRPENELLITLLLGKNSFPIPNSPLFKFSKFSYSCYGYFPSDLIDIIGIWVSI